MEPLREGLMEACLCGSSIIIEGGIFLSHGLWLFRTRAIRKAAKLAGKTFDDVPESEPYHVDVPHKGSIAASRDVESVEIARRGSVALALDLERGEEMAVTVAGGKGRRSFSGLEHLERVEEVSSIRSEEVGSLGGVGGKEEGKGGGVRVREEEVRGEAVDYGTMGGVGKGKRKDGGGKRPGYVRQDSNMGSLTFFKEPEW